MRKHTILHYILTAVIILMKGLLFSVVGAVIGLLGLGVFQNGASPWNLVIGLPLIFLGIGVVAHALWSMLLALFSPTHNRNACLLCSR